MVGVRGLVTLRVLELIEKELKDLNPEYTLSDMFDYIVGTSTGGIIALGLRTGKSVTEISEIYMQLAESVFSDKPPCVWKASAIGGGVGITTGAAIGVAVGSPGGPIGMALGGAIGAISGALLGAGAGATAATGNLLYKLSRGGIYSEKKLESILKKNLVVNNESNPTLGRLEKPTILTSCKSETSAPIWIDSTSNAYASIPLHIVARMTSAAPFYFEPVPVRMENGKTYHFIDGGTHRNNPALSFITDIPRAEHLFIASVGTGLPPGNAPESNRAPLDLALQAVIQSATATEVDHQTLGKALQHRQGCEYYRFQPALQESYGLDECRINNLLNMRWVDTSMCDRSTVFDRNQNGKQFNPENFARALIGIV